MDSHVTTKNKSIPSSTSAAGQSSSRILVPQFISGIKNKLSIIGSKKPSSPVAPGAPTPLPRTRLKEAFISDEHSNAYDILIKQCGAGSSSKLQQCATIQRLHPNCEVYRDILDYVNNSREDKKVKVHSIYKVQRMDDQNKSADESFRILLWHGTDGEVIPGIIETGFRKGKGGMFGGAVYFADRISKSLVYTTKSKTNGLSFLILAEVCPGKMYKAHHFHTKYRSPPNGYNSVKGNGGRIPTWKDNRDYFMTIIPCGETCDNPRHPSYDMKYNEYVIYDMDRVTVRFIVECTF